MELYCRNLEVDISGVRRPLIWVISIATLHITLLLTTHEPASSLGFRAFGSAFGVQRLDKGSDFGDLGPHGSALPQGEIEMPGLGGPFKDPLRVP